MLNTCKRIKQQELFSVERSGFKVPKEDPFVKLMNIYDFERWYPILSKYENRSGIGRPSKDVLVKMKMMFIGYYLDIKDAKVEKMVNRDLILKHFCELDLTEEAPDHTALCRLRKSISEKTIQELFADVVNVAREKKIITDNFSATDASHYIANVSEKRQSVSNQDKETSKSQKYAKNKEKAKPVLDKDAMWGCKKKDHWFYGYKLHASLDVDSYMITRIHVTSGEAHDGKEFVQVLETRAKHITADKIYDTAVNKQILKDLEIRNWIYRKNRKAAQWIVNKRTCIERKFGEAKKWHGFETCRYIGMMGAKIHSYMTAIAMNLKRMLQLIAV